MTSITSMETASAFEKFTGLFVGPEKGGKSSLAATARKPVLFLDFDHRKEALAGRKGVFAISEELREPSWPNQPTAYHKTLNILADIEQGKLLLDGQAPKTLVFDSVSTFAKSAGAYAWFTTPDIRRTISVSGIQFHMPKGFDGWNAEMSLVESVIVRALAVPGLDIIAILHEQPEEAPESTNEKPSYTGKVAVYPTRYRLLLKYFNEIYRITREQGKVPEVQIQPNWKFTASTNFKLDVLPVLDIEQVIASQRV